MSLTAWTRKIAVTRQERGFYITGKMTGSKNRLDEKNYSKNWMKNSKSTVGDL